MNRRSLLFAPVLASLLTLGACTDTTPATEGGSSASPEATADNASGATVPDTTHGTNPNVQQQTGAANPPPAAITQPEARPGGSGH